METHYVIAASKPEGRGQSKLPLNLYGELENSFRALGCYGLSWRDLLDAYGAIKKAAREEIGW